MLRAVLLLIVCGLLSAGPVIAQSSAPAAAPTWDGTYRRARVPILMYHYISSPPDAADVYRRDLSTPPDAFHAQMDYLFYQGFTPITLGDLDTALLTGLELPAKPVILTFDDGYADHHAHAFPILREFGFTGTFFVITGRADEADPAHLSWPQIAEMSAAGMQMESHTKSHPDLRGRDADFLVYELLGSLESLRHYTGGAGQMFAYPAGQYDDAVLRMLASLEIRRAVTTQPGDWHTTDNRLELTRTRVSAGITIAQFAALVGE